MTRFTSPELARAAEIALKRGYFNMESDDINVWKNSFVGRFLARWPKCAKTIDVFASVLGHVPTWDDITDTNLRDLREALSNGRCPSSVKTMCAQLKAVLNAYAYEVHNGKDPLAICDIAGALKVKRNTSDAVYLTQGELERLHNVNTISDNERYVKRVFMVEALTGARHIDAERISSKHCSNGSLTYRAEKTGRPVIVPVHKWLEEYLDTSDVAPVTRLATFNDLLRSLCCRAHIDGMVTLTRRGEEQQGPKWQFVSSHTGRRTFATLLFLHGTDVTTIARLMGHSDPQVTWRNYICAERQLDDHTLQFFN